MPGEPLLPLDVLQDLKGALDKDSRYLVKVIQLICAPTRRSLPDAYAPRAEVPWRYTLLLLGSGQVVKEPWHRIHGLGSISFPKATYQRLQPAWAVHVYGDPRPIAEDDELTTDGAPVSLGKLMQALSSPNERMVKQGAQELHIRFRHAPVRKIQQIVQSAGIDVD